MRDEHLPRIRSCRRCAGKGPALARVAGCFACLAVFVPTAAEAASPAKSLNVKWSEDYDSVQFDFRGTRYDYPKQFVQDTFPPIDQPPQIDFKAE